MFIPIIEKDLVFSLSYFEFTRVTQECQSRLRAMQAIKDRLTPDQIDTVRRRESGGSNIQTIKAVRERFGLSLGDAKFLIDWIEADARKESK